MYTRSLEQECPVRIPGVLEWRPDENTPDVVYYQVRIDAERVREGRRVGC